MVNRRHRNAASGRFAAARDAEADPERHVAERVRALPVLRIERMNCGIRNWCGLLNQSVLLRPHRKPSRRQSHC